MSDRLTIHIASAETLIDAAAGMILDAANVLHDAADEAAAQDLEALATLIAAEADKLRQRRAALQRDGAAA